MSLLSSSNMNLKKIGKGTFGDVYLHPQTNRVYKYAKLFKDNLIVIDNTIREAAFYKNIQNAKRNILQSIPNDDTLQRFTYPPSSIPNCSVTTSEQYQNNRLLFIMDYAGTPLTDHKYTSKQVTYHIFTQICEALVWLHKSNMSHGDLKPSNIVVMPNGKATLIDYGSLFFTNTIPIQNQRCTTYYISPEELETNIPTPSNDIWSFGVTLFEHVTGEAFLPNLLQFLHTPKAKINEFIKGCKQETESCQPAIFLREFFSSIQYSNLLPYLYKKLKDRELLSIISNCLLFDKDMRITAPTLYKLLLSLQSKPIPFPLILPPTVYNEPLIYRTYKMVKHHAGVNAEIRETMINFIVTLCSLQPNGNFLIAHSIMMIDRFMFRNFPNPLPFSLETHLAIVCSLTLAVLQGSYITFQSISRGINQQTSVDVIKQCILETLHTLDYKTFHVCPGLGETTSTEWLMAFIDNACNYPVIHSTLSYFTK